MAGLIGTALQYATMGSAMAIGQFGLTAKENRYQMSRLITEVNNAFHYCSYLDDLMDDITAHPEEYNQCVLKNFTKHKDELCSYINDEILGSKGVINELKKQTNELAEGTKILEKIKKLEKDRAKTAEYEKLLKTGFVQKWPEWYRIEVATRLNNAQIVVDQLTFKSRGNAKCKRIAEPVKQDLAPISNKWNEMCEEIDGEIFCETLEQPAQAAGRKYRKNKY